MSGSCDGKVSFWTGLLRLLIFLIKVRIWKYGEDGGEVKQIGEIECEGFVNSMVMKSASESEEELRLSLIMGVGKEHRLGRWWTVKDSLSSRPSNCAYLYPITVPKTLDE